MTFSQTGTIFKIKKFALHDGPGIRTTVFLKGCPLTCWWCHNPEGQSPDPQSIDRKVEEADGAIGFRKEVVGRVVTVPEVLKEIEKDIIFYDESGGGATFSGGEPFLQADFLRGLLSECRKRDIHTTVDTSGFVAAELLDSFLDGIDLFLFDVKLLDNQQHQYYTGVSNRQVLDNLRRLSDAGKPVIVRLPLIPGITDTRENLQLFKMLVAQYNNVQRIDILPYHRIASEKYNRLGMIDRMPGVTPPAASDVEAVQKLFEQTGLPVLVGG